MIDLSSGDGGRINIKIVDVNGTFKNDVDKVKSIEGRRYNPDTKMWNIDGGQLDTLVGLFQPDEISWSMPNPYKKIKPAVANFDITLDYIDEMKLKPYDFQIIGINFLTQIKRCLIGDEMGLGKTSQAIGGAYRLYRAGEVTKALVLCPASVKYQWGQEIEKFCNLSYVVVDGTKAKRQEAYASDAFFVIVNYELLLRDIDDIAAVLPDIIICDEVHRIKSWTSQTSKNILKLDAEYKWGLTGTPLQNRPEEIFNVFAFLEPSILGNLWAFRKKYVVIGDAYGRKNVPLGPKNLDDLHRRLSPYMLRRLKKDVAKDLPEMIYTPKIIEMTKDQAQLNNLVFKDFQQLMDKVDAMVERDEYGDIIKSPPEADRALGYFILLQEISDSLELLSMSDSKMAQGYDISSKDSPKLEELYEICKEKLDNDPNAKIVVFTQFERMQRLVEAKLKKLGKAVVLNGATPGKKRQEAIDSFKTDSSIKFFLATDSGNYGINLQESDLLINVDIPWNPAIFLQRAARIHRLTSTHDSVEIISLLCRGSIDEIIYNTMYKKMEIAGKVIEYTDEEKEELDNVTVKKLKSLLGGRK